MLARHGSIGCRPSMIVGFGLAAGFWRAAISTSGGTSSRLQIVAAQTFRCDPALIQEQTTARDVPRWDSLRHLVFIGNVEQAFGCRLDLATVMQLDDMSERCIDEIVKITVGLTRHDERNTGQRASSIGREPQGQGAARRTRCGRDLRCRRRHPGRRWLGRGRAGMSASPCVGDLTMDLRGARGSRRRSPGGRLDASLRGTVRLALAGKSGRNGCRPDEPSGSERRADRARLARGTRAIHSRRTRPRAVATQLVERYLELCESAAVAAGLSRDPAEPRACARSISAAWPIAAASVRPAPASALSTNASRRPAGAGPTLLDVEALAERIGTQAFASARLVSDPRACRSTRAILAEYVTTFRSAWRCIRGNAEEGARP